MGAILVPRLAEHGLLRAGNFGEFAFEETFERRVPKSHERRQTQSPLWKFRLLLVG
jgi:hypothetical protein